MPWSDCVDDPHVPKDMFSQGEVHIHYETTSIQYGTFYGCKNETFQMKNVIFLLYSLETEIVGTFKNRLVEALLTGNHNLCFIAEIRKIMYTPANPIFSI